MLQDDKVVWLTVSTPQIVDVFNEQGFEVLQYIVRQMKGTRGFKNRSFTKVLTLKDVNGRNEQFMKIEKVRSECEVRKTPLLSIDTKKKELKDNFKHQGKVSFNGTSESYNHAFHSFVDRIIVPNGIYDLGSNICYLTLGTSHDTSEFVCDNSMHVWQEHLQWRCHDAKIVCALCDGGSSNAASHYIIKQSLMKLASTIGVYITHVTLFTVLF